MQNYKYRLKCTLSFEEYFHPFHRKTESIGNKKCITNSKQRKKYKKDSNIHKGTFPIRNN